MRKKIILLACAGTLALSACDNMTPKEQMIVGGLAGATVGLMTAGAISANPNWTLLALLGGAAVGTLVARNHATNECAYAAGNGRYRVVRCP